MERWTSALTSALKSSGHLDTDEVRKELCQMLLKGISDAELLAKAADPHPKKGGSQKIRWISVMCYLSQIWDRTMHNMDVEEIKQEIQRLEGLIAELHEKASKIPATSTGSSLTEFSVQLSLASGAQRSG